MAPRLPAARRSPLRGPARVPAQSFIASANGSPFVKTGRDRHGIPLISVIVPTYNRSEMLADALESLLRQETGGEFRYEILVVDNASTDAD